MDIEHIEQFATMWGRDKDFYLLAESNDGTGDVARYVIIDMRTNHALLIESPGVAAEVKRRMHAAGVRVGKLGDLKIRKSFIRARIARERGTP